MASLIQVFCHTRSARLHYICDWIFKEQCQVDYTLIDTIEDLDPNNPIINYTDSPLSHPAIPIQPIGLLEETGIRTQSINGFHYLSFSNPENSLPAFFKTEKSEWPFDLFSSVFYLVTRYEEYTEPARDEHGRFPHTQSLAYRMNFLHMPLIQHWLLDLRWLIQNKWPTVSMTIATQSPMITYDIDMAWSYLHKGWLRNLAGWLKQPSLIRIQVLVGNKPDPFDIFDDLIVRHQETNTSALFFFPAGSSHNRYDKHISLNVPALQTRIRQIASYFDIGMHPSYYSMQEPERLITEKKRLEQLLDKQIIRSRQHYIRFTLPETYRSLIEAGIREEYSMGYGSINGFRASTSSSFLWYDLTAERTTALRVFPFSFMDANCIFEEKIDASAAWDYYCAQLHQCQRVGGMPVSIFHNHLLANESHCKEWIDLLARILHTIAPAQP
ncbi:MAG: polysaccharide deacetylase family protein [Ferruginibacter sp.]